MSNKANEVRKEEVRKFVADNKAKLINEAKQVELAIRSNKPK